MLLTYCKKFLQVIQSFDCDLFFNKLFIYLYLYLCTLCSIEVNSVYFLELSGSINLRQSSSSPNNLLKHRAFYAVVFGL